MDIFVFSFLEVSSKRNGTTPVFSLRSLGILKTNILKNPTAFNILVLPEALAPYILPIFNNLTPSFTSYEYSSDINVSEVGSKLIFCDDLMEKKFSVENSAIIVIAF
jgi:hypothetical protein